MIAEKVKMFFLSFLTGNSAADGRAAGSYDAPAPPLLRQAGCLEASPPAAAAAGAHCPSSLPPIALPPSPPPLITHLTRNFACVL